MKSSDSLGHLMAAGGDTYAQLLVKFDKALAELERTRARNDVLQALVEPLLQWRLCYLLGMPELEPGRRAKLTAAVDNYRLTLPPETTE